MYYCIIYQKIFYRIVPKKTEKVNQENSNTLELCWLLLCARGRAGGGAADDDDFHLKIIEVGVSSSLTIIIMIWRRG